MAGVINPGQRDVGLLSTVMKGLSIARDVYGIKTDMARLEQQEALDKQRADAEAATKKEKEWLARGGMTKGQLNAQILGGKVQEVPQGTPGAIPIATDPNQPGLVTYVARVTEPKIGKSPTTQNFADGTTRQYDAATGEWKILATKPKAAAGAAGGGKVVSGEVAQKIGQYDAAMTQIDSLEKDWLKKTGSLSGIAQYLPGTDAAQYVDAQKLAAQNIGQIIEGGKLTDTDFDRYLSMMPTAGDSEERAAEKFARLKAYVAERKKTSVEGAQQAGYKTQGFAPAVVSEPKLGRGTDGKAFGAPGGPPSPIKVGTVEDGYEFLGGNPADKNNWKKVTK